MSSTTPWEANSRVQRLIHGDGWGGPEDGFSIGTSVVTDEWRQPKEYAPRSEYSRLITRDDSGSERRSGGKFKKGRVARDHLRDDEGSYSYPTRSESERDEDSSSWSKRHGGRRRHRETHHHGGGGEQSDVEVVAVEGMVERVEVPVVKTIEKNITKIVEVPVREIVEKVVETVVEKVIEVPVEKIVEKTVDKVVVKTVEVPVERIVEKIIEVPVEVPVERIVERIVEVPREVPVIKTVEKIVEVPVSRTVEKIVEVPVEKIVKVPVEKLVQKIVETPTPVDKWAHDEEFAALRDKNSSLQAENDRLRIQISRMAEDIDKLRLSGHTTGPYGRTTTDDPPVLGSSWGANTGTALIGHRERSGGSGTTGRHSPGSLEQEFLDRPSHISSYNTTDDFVSNRHNSTATPNRELRRATHSSVGRREYSDSELETGKRRPKQQQVGWGDGPRSARIGGTGSGWGRGDESDTSRRTSESGRRSGLSGARKVRRAGSVRSTDKY